MPGTGESPPLPPQEFSASIATTNTPDNTVSASAGRKKLRRVPSTTWIHGEGGNVYYRRRVAKSTRRLNDQGPFPTPLIGPRRARPHAIHILTFPSGYVPRDLRPLSASAKKEEARRQERQQAKEAKKEEQRRRSIEKEIRKRENRQSRQENPSRRLSTITAASTRTSTSPDDSVTGSQIAREETALTSSSSSSSLRPRLSRLLSSFSGSKDISGPPNHKRRNSSISILWRTLSPSASRLDTPPIAAVAGACTPADSHDDIIRPERQSQNLHHQRRRQHQQHRQQGSPPNRPVDVANSRPHLCQRLSGQFFAAARPSRQRPSTSGSTSSSSATNTSGGRSDLADQDLGQTHAYVSPLHHGREQTQTEAHTHTQTETPHLTTGIPHCQSRAAQQDHHYSPVEEQNQSIVHRGQAVADPQHHRTGSLSLSPFQIPASNSRPSSFAANSSSSPGLSSLPSSLSPPELSHSPLSTASSSSLSPASSSSALTPPTTHSRLSYDDAFINAADLAETTDPSVFPERFFDPDPTHNNEIALMTTARMAAPAPAGQGYNVGAGGAGVRSVSAMSHRPGKNSITSMVTEVPKPVASGSGVACSILLAEPNVFLSGFDHDGRSQRESGSSALLRGKLQLKISKNVKIKAIQLKLLGRARTEWPEGIPPLKQDMFQEESLRTQVLTFFNAMNEGWESDYGNQCSYSLKNSSANSSSTNLAAAIASTANTASAPSRSGGLLAPPGSSNGKISTSDLRRLSLQSAQSRSFGKGESPIASSTQAKGFKVFYPGTYDYSFELPIDHHQLETIKLQYGSVKWELQATVDRAGAFKPNLHGTKEVSIVRLPDQLSLEMSEPISISRRWEDQLHYDIVISGKSFPIGSKIPIAFKLTPLAKVQVHKLRVFVTESVEYWTNDKRVTRKDPGRKILLLEKSAGKPLDPSWASSNMRTIRGGELDAEQRREARNLAHRRRASEAARRQAQPDPLPEPTDNLLGDIDLGLESFWGSTEIEANVQMPTCEMMAKNKDLRLHPDCSWKNVNVYHWIKIVMRISRLDPEDPSGTKRRHFEISIDSPFTVLNCRATQANTNLPAYAGPMCQPGPFKAACGCPDAPSIVTESSPNSSTGTLPGLDSNDNLPAPPQAAHLHGSGPPSPHPPPQTDPLGGVSNPRPMHLLRVPSFNPPAFDEDTAPPPAHTINTNVTEEAPPPQYDVVVGTPSVDGMADYFARLAQHGLNDEDDVSDSDESPPRILERTGRVNVSHPRTPGGRMQSRSFELQRPPTLDFALQMPALPSRPPPAPPAPSAEAPPAPSAEAPPVPSAETPTPSP